MINIINSCLCCCTTVACDHEPVPSASLLIVRKRQYVRNLDVLDGDLLIALKLWFTVTTHEHTDTHSRSLSLSATRSLYDSDRTSSSTSITVVGLLRGTIQTDLHAQSGSLQFRAGQRDVACDGSALKCAARKNRPHLALH